MNNVFHLISRSLSGVAFSPAYPTKINVINCPIVIGLLGYTDLDRIVPIRPVGFYVCIFDTLVKNCNIFCQPKILFL